MLIDCCSSGGRKRAVVSVRSKQNKTYLGNYCRNNQYSACLCVGLSSRERATETELELLELEEAEEETMRRLEQDENCDEKRRELSLRVTCNFTVSVGDGQKMLLFLVTVQSEIPIPYII